MRHTRRDSSSVRLTLRFYPGQDDDLIHWLDELDKDRLGAKNQTVKERLRMAVGAELPQATVVASALDLVEVRQVVEAAVASALSRLEGQVVGMASTTTTDDEDEVENLLDALEQALVLGKEEDL
jgi:hypothetical protein